LQLPRQHLWLPQRPRSARQRRPPGSATSVCPPPIGARSSTRPTSEKLTDKQTNSVEWARDNAAAFGGDPDKIILWGQSAGAYSATNYGYAWHEDPIVKGIIAHSGGTGPYITAVDTTHAAFGLAAAASGCANLSASAELECMQGVDAADLLAFVVATPAAVFAPGADGVTVFPDNAQRAADGRVAQVPSIIGSNAREGTAFATTWDEDSVNEAEVEFLTTAIRCVALAEVA
jgi:carboxylesterase type B